MRFCVLHHTGWPGHADHYDLLLLPQGESTPFRGLKTWSTLDDVFPTGEGSGTSMIKKPDHRIFYLDYEGPVFGSRGVVMRADFGNLYWLPPATEIVPSESRFRLEGKKLLGEFYLRPDGVDRYVLQKSA